MSEDATSKIMIACLVGEAVLDVRDNQTTLRFHALDAKKQSLQVTLNATAMFQLAEVLVRAGHDFPEALAMATSKRR